jgi:tryptophan synthase alpha chain
VTIADVFAKAKAENRSALIGCMPAGFPTVDASIASMRAMAEAGCDVIEVELPYSDPVMDGPVIQKASDIALAGGVRTRDTLRIIEAPACRSC